MEVKNALQALSRILTAYKSGLFKSSRLLQGQGLVPHAFSFSGFIDGWAEHTELLAFSYGNELNRLSQEIVSEGAVLDSEFERAGPLPTPEQLQVRWRRKRDARVFEQHVDLRGRLPTQLHGYHITFTIEQDQLFVYLITPEKVPFKLPGRPAGTWHSEYYITYEIHPGGRRRSPFEGWA